VNRRWFMLGAAGFALCLLPYLACSSREGSADTSHSATNLSAAVLGTWQGSAEIDGETVPFSLVLQPAARQSSAARGLSLIGTLTSENPELNGAIDGVASIEVDGDRIDAALRLDDGKVLSGRVEAGVITDGRIHDKAAVGSFTMSRQ